VLAPFFSYTTFVLSKMDLGNVDIWKRPVGGGGEGVRGVPLEAQDFNFAFADLTERRLLDCQDCQD